MTQAGPQAQAQIFRLLIDLAHRDFYNSVSGRNGDGIKGIRMISSEAILKTAEKVAENIVESSKRPPMTFQEFQQLWGTSNP